MRSPALQHRLYATCITGALLASVLMPLTAHASGNATYEFRPHCEGDDVIENKFGGPSPDVKGMMKLTEGTCRTFDVRDPSSMQSDVLHAGDTLDMDIVVNNPDHRSISRFRAWVAYDPTILEGIDVSISPSFPVPTPGESQFIPAEGTLKLSGSATTPVTKDRFPIARVRFRVLKDTLDGTPLVFTETTGDIDAKSGVFEGAIPDEQNILSMINGSLYVRLAGAASPASTAMVSSDGTQTGTTASSAMSSTEAAAATSMPLSSASTTTASSAATSMMQKAFTLLQVLGLRVTTEGSSVFLAWDALPSSELAGYNVYYGTVSGRYIQRKSVDRAANSLTIRALPVGTTYYFAVRAYNATGEETVFSQEVGISVGNPKTSTSPLNANTLITKTPSTGGKVSGETGISSTLLFLVLGCAAVGTLITVRRQMNTPSAS